MSWFVNLVSGIAFTLLLGARALAGTWTSGGGHGVLDARGQIRLVDTLDSASVLQAPTHEQLAEIYAGPRAVRALLSDFSDFENMFLRVVARWDKHAPIMSKEFRDKIKYVSVKFAHYDAYKIHLAKSQDLGIAPSPSVSAHLQFPIALFSHQSVVVFKNVFDKLSESDKAALVVHESLRQFSFGRALTSKTLTNEEVEFATRLLIGPVTQQNALELTEVLGYAEFEQNQARFRKLAQLIRQDATELHSAFAPCRYLEAAASRIEEYAIDLYELSNKQGVVAQFELFEIADDLEYKVLWPTLSKVDDNGRCSNIAPKISRARQYVTSFKFALLASGMQANETIVSGITLQLSIFDHLWSLQSRGSGHRCYDSESLQATGCP